ncbi:MAG: ABC transporter, permease protein 2 (cluster 1, maltose/g3p/polyamine/iron) [uncultured Rubrobacteraceae bacterium]|uniref:ABC transporter, permease protein 2 (Cluster 1, maltose/g3p/polyamine/iron) n=1 Tax=uncultured Rubrobacteraceae bacterium TaxID=349277 RepID=A0A6J4Q647_9ACTN|nr:MAG: ABC transporter, permease protein 2 (cluster 1, maltose/g3p/polyamine/iron) [uncultured Rubrobacteraceae bacterium]
MKGRSRRMSEPARLILYIFLGVGALVTLYPFYWTLTAATLTESEIFKSPPRLLPGDEFFANLRTLSESAPFLRALLNSMFVATVTTVSTVFLSALAGYAFAKFRFRGRNLMFVVVLGTLMLPTEIMIVPLFIIMLQLGWVDSFAALIVPYLVTGFGVFLMRQQMMGFPNDLLDAARIDGNGELGAFFRVVLPNMKAACAALGIVTFMSQWGNFLWPLVIISTPEKFTYPLMLSSLVRQGGAVEYAPIMVAAVIGLIPLVLLFFFFQKYIVSGVFGGSLKE